MFGLNNLKRVEKIWEDILIFTFLLMQKSTLGTEVFNTIYDKIYNVYVIILNIYVLTISFTSYDVCLKLDKNILLFLK